MDTVCGIVEKITFYNPENGFCVARLLVKKESDDLVTIVGTLPAIQPGETIECQGEWKLDPSFGKQLEVHSYHIETPQTLEGIYKYLSSGQIKGIGPKFAQKIVDTFGVKTLQIMEEAPERLAEIAGMGEKKIEKIKVCWSAQKEIRELMIFLQSHQIPPSIAYKIYKVYGQNSIENVTQNPYQLISDIHGIGFKTADTLAEKLGIDKVATTRVQAALLHILHTFCYDNGYTCCLQEQLLQEAKELIEISEELVQEAFEGLVEEKKLIFEACLMHGKQVHLVWPRTLFFAEKSIASSLQTIISAPSSLRSIDTEKALVWVENLLKLTFAEMQKKAIESACREKFLIITGGPGTGKSTITRAILSIYEKLTDKIILTAPTGRAAKRMTEITGKPAKTIHSLLEYSFKERGFRKNAENLLEVDLIIVDESSMIDTYLMSSLLKAIPQHAKVILIGDIYQLPSIGPGNVLKDILGSQRVCTVTLHQIFRQSEGSQIIINAHRIQEGQFPYLYGPKNRDFFLVEANTPEKVLSELISLVTARLPKRYDLDPIKEIQVLSPMKKGIIGIQQLNSQLQKMLNPEKFHIYRSGKMLGKHDKVIQLKNNYSKEVFNGDIGIIETIDPTDQEVCVLFDDKKVTYDFQELDEIDLAYAISVHKYQGSECPCVVIPVHTSHFMMLQRNLLYTAITRGKKLVVLVGSKKALIIAIKNNAPQERLTFLQQHLLELE